MPIDKDYQMDEKFVSCPGERYRPVYTPEILDDGNIELVQTGVEDLQELYNSQRESCDISVLVAKFLAGDETALNRGNPVFMDLLGTPKSLMEAYQVMYRSQNAFELLPADIRAKFNGDFSKFIADAGKPEWFDALKVDNVKESGKVDESAS